MKYSRIFYKLVIDILHYIYNIRARIAVKAKIPVPRLIQMNEGQGGIHRIGEPQPRGIDIEIIQYFFKKTPN